MVACLAKITPLDRTAGARFDVRVAWSQDRRVLGLGGNVWEPAMIEAPAIGIALWNGDFVNAIDPGGATMVLNLAEMPKTFPGIEKCYWPGAAVEIYSGAPGDAWPWTTRFKGRITSFSGVFPHLSLTAEVDDEPFRKNVLTAFYAGTGGAEGPESLANRAKPLILGAARNVEPILIDAANSVFQFSGAGPIEAVSALYERGAQFPAAVADHANYAALVGATIPRGMYATCLAQGMVRLGAPPYGLITGDVLGHKVGGATPRKTGAVISALASIAGVDAGLIESATLSALDANKPYDINLVITEQADFLDWARRLALPCNWQAGVSLAGKLFVASPVIAGGVAMTLDAQGRASPQVLASEESDTSPPYSLTVMGANRCWRVHSADEIAFQADLIETGAYDAAKTYREGNVVSLGDGSRWVYINPTPTAGNAPPDWPTTSNAWWANLSPPLDLATALTGLLTNPTHIVAANASGVVTDFSDAGGQFYLVKGGAVLTSGVAYNVVSETGVDVSINAATGVYSVASMSADDGTAVFRATHDGEHIDLTYSIAKARAGANGVAPKLIRLVATRLAIGYNSSGSPSPTSQTNVFIVEKQNTTASVTWSVQDLNGVNRTPVSSFLTVAGDTNSATMTVAQFNSAQNGTGGVIVTATVTDGAVLTEKASVHKVQAGADGSDGAPAIGFVQANPPASGAFINQTWYETDTKFWWRWTGTVWARILGDLSALNMVATQYIEENAITNRVSVLLTDSWTSGDYPDMRCFLQLDIAATGGNIHLLGEVLAHTIKTSGAAIGQSYGILLAVTRGPTNVTIQNTATTLASYLVPSGRTQLLTPTQFFLFPNTSVASGAIFSPRTVLEPNLVDNPAAGSWRYGLWAGPDSALHYIGVNNRRYMLLTEMKR